MNVNLKILSIPDHKSQLLVAKLVVAQNHTLSMQHAMEIAANPPVMLRNMSIHDSKEHIVHFKAYGISFKVLPTESTPHAALAPHVDDYRDSRAKTPPSNPQEFDSAIKEILELAAADNKPIDAADNRGGEKTSKTRYADSGNDPPPPAKSVPLKSDPPPADHRPSQQTMPPQGGRFTGLARKRKTRRIGHIDTNAIEELERESRKKAILVVLVAVGAFFIIGTITLILPAGDKQASQKSQSVTAVGGKAAQSPSSSEAQNKTGERGAAAGIATIAQSGADSAQAEPPTALDSASLKQARQATAYVDSAKAVDGDLMRQIAFYKLAIQFNRRNLPAWQGLLQAYLEGGMMREAAQTEREIIAIFGPEVMSVNSIIKASFGELTNAYAARDGTYRVDYNSRKTNTSEIMRDIFEMVRSVRSACNCRDITIHASTGSGKGVIAHIPESASAHSFADFSRQANITWMDR